MEGSGDGDTGLAEGSGAGSNTGAILNLLGPLIGSSSGGGGGGGGGEGAEEVCMRLKVRRWTNFHKHTFMTICY